MEPFVPILPHVNASLNAAALCLLLTGLILIKRGRERAHMRVMLACFAVSILFLTSYVVYHCLAGSRPFPSTQPATIRVAYYTILLTHVLLAAILPFLALATITLGLRDRRAAHRRLAKWTFPIWVYVAVTGLLVYVMLYHLFAPRAPDAILRN
jgi:uncharacterized membrane protein YozB (DUF420 family)